MRGAIPVQIDFFIPGEFADAACTTLLATDALTYFIWGGPTSYVVQISHRVGTKDSGENQPRVTISVDGSVVGTDNTNAGLPVNTSWAHTVVGINTSNYDINMNEAIEIITDANGTNDNAKDLTVRVILVTP